MIYKHVYIYTYTHIYIYIHTYIYMNTYNYMYMYIIYMHINVMSGGHVHVQCISTGLYYYICSESPQYH